MVMSELDGCDHLKFIGNMCTVCKKFKDECGNPITLPFNFLYPGTSFTLEGIKNDRDEDFRSLLQRKKLHLILDLDNTLVHSKLRRDLTVEDQIYVSSRKKLLGAGDRGTSDDIYVMEENKRVLKLRPGAVTFVKKLSTLFDLSIYTRGTRYYGQQVAEILDRSLFRHVIGREDCLKNHRKGLDIVLSHERVVLIVDDNEVVWTDSGKANLIKIAPYKFFVEKDFPSTLREKEGRKAMDAELARVLSTLRIVHRIFYKGDGDYLDRDVRTVLQRMVPDGSVTHKEEEEKEKQCKGLLEDAVIACEKSSSEDMGALVPSPKRIKFKIKVTMPNVPCLAI